MSNSGKSELLLSAFALIVAVGTAAFTYLQYRVADRARQEIHDDAMQTLRLSYRPYVAAHGSLDPKRNIPGGPAVGAVTLQFTTSGNTPALDMTFRKACSTFEIPDGQKDKTPPREVWPPLTAALPHGVLFPGQTISLSCLVCISKACKEAAHSHSSMGQTLSPDKSVSPQETDRSPEIDLAVFAVGDVSYTDVFQKRHKTTFCVYTFETSKVGEMYPCTQENSLD
jgi:hypothetical protein